MFNAKATNKAHSRLLETVKSNLAGCFLNSLPRDQFIFQRAELYVSDCGLFFR